MKKVVWSAIARVAIVAVTLTGVSCGELTRQGQSASYVIVTELVAASGAEPEEFGGTLFSDVITMVEVENVRVPTVFADLGRVTMQLALKDPGPPSSPNAPTANNFITINRYRVTFTRADGRNTPGVDVPFGFDGAVTFTVGAGAVTHSFELVRHIAKQEAPLRALASSEVVIATIADVTFYGHDQTGREVSAQGRLLVQFGNFGDPQ